MGPLRHCLMTYAGVGILGYFADGSWFSLKRAEKDSPHFGRSWKSAGRDPAFVRAV